MAGDQHYHVEGTRCYRCDPDPRYCDGDGRGVKHEWRQYMQEIEWGNRDRGYRHRLAPNGFFCVHCMTRKA